MSLFQRLFFGKNSSTSPPQNSKQTNPLKGLVGQTIEVHHINQDIPGIETAILIFSPNEDYFYMGESRQSYHLIHWNQTDHKGRRDAVRLIKDSKGNIIYENPQISFDYKAPEYKTINT